MQITLWWGLIVYLQAATLIRFLFFKAFTP